MEDADFLFVFKWNMRFKYPALIVIKAIHFKKQGKSLYTRPVFKFTKTNKKTLTFRPSENIVARWEFVLVYI